MNAVARDLQPSANLMGLFERIVLCPRTGGDPRACLCQPKKEIDLGARAHG
jgi:hypothetical protein